MWGLDQDNAFNFKLEVTTWQLCNLTAGIKANWWNFTQLILIPMVVSALVTWSNPYNCSWRVLDDNVNAHMNVAEATVDILAKNIAILSKIGLLSLLDVCMTPPEQYRDMLCGVHQTKRRAANGWKGESEFEVNFPFKSKGYWLHLLEFIESFQTLGAFYIHLKPMEFSSKFSRT